MFQLTIGKADQGMSCFELAASLAGSLGWPIAVALIAFLFRRQVAALLDRLHEVAHGDTKFTFKDDVQKIAEKMEAVEAAAPRIAEGAGNAEGKSTATAHGEAVRSRPSNIPSAKELLNAINFVDVDPSDAVLRSWKLISDAVESLAIKHGLGVTKPYFGRTFDTAKKLKEQGVFSTQVMVILSELRKKRNAAAHGQEVDADGALRYIQLVSRFLYLIEYL